MAETQAPKPVTKEDLIKTCETRKESYLKKSGVTNYNPHLFIAQKVNVLIDKIDKAPTVTDDLIKAVNALPVECPVINPNYVEPVAPKIVAPAMPAGAK